MKQQQQGEDDLVYSENISSNMDSFLPNEFFQKFLQGQNLVDVSESVSQLYGKLTTEKSYRDSFIDDQNFQQRIYESNMRLIKEITKSEKLERQNKDLEKLLEKSLSENQKFMEKIQKEKEEIEKKYQGQINQLERNNFMLNSDNLILKKQIEKQNLQISQMQEKKLEQKSQLKKLKVDINQKYIEIVNYKAKISELEEQLKKYSRPLLSPQNIEKQTSFYQFGSKYQLSQNKPILAKTESSFLLNEMNKISKKNEINNMNPRINEIKEINEKQMQSPNLGRSSTPHSYRQEFAQTYTGNWYHQNSTTNTILNDKSYNSQQIQNQETIDNNIHIRNHSRGDRVNEKIQQHQSSTKDQMQKLKESLKQLNIIK